MNERFRDAPQGGFPAVGVGYGSIHTIKNGLGAWPSAPLGQALFLALFLEAVFSRAARFRRNLIVRGVDLSAWVGKRFVFQGVTFEGSEECKPCYWMDQAVAPGAEEFLKSRFRGGLRARILSDGVLKVSSQ